MKTLKLTALFIIYHLALNISYAQSPVDSVASGCALDFNGVSNYVQVDSPSNSPLNNISSKITIEMWVYQKSPSAAGGVGVTKEGHYKFGPSSSLDCSLPAAYIFRLATTGQGWAAFLCSNSPTILNKWTHIAATYNSVNSKAKIYINGILDTKSTTAMNGTIVKNQAPIWIGKGLTPFLYGKIDEVRIWNYVRSRDEIRQNMCKKLTGNEPGLVGYWPFDDCGGNIATDASGNGNNGTLH